MHLSKHHEIGNENAPRGDSDSSLESKQALDLSVVICTRNRAQSLCQLLDCLASDDREGIHFEVVVVDNGDSDKTRAVVQPYDGALNLRYFVETRPGKCHAMNRALDEGGLGEIVAFLDDDLSLEPGWLRGVKSGCERWPDHDIFSGRSHVVFPDDVSIPSWATSERFSGWAFSVNDPGTTDHEMRRGFWPSGNHFWIRSRALGSRRRFPDLWILPEPGLILGLQEDGYKGAWIGNVVAGHRIQPHLLDRGTVLLRMAQFGRDFPYVRLSNPKLFRQARLFRDYPLVWVALSTLNLVRWYAWYLRACLRRDNEERFFGQITSSVRLYDNLETLLHWRRIRRFIMDEQRLHTRHQADLFERFYNRP